MSQIVVVDSRCRLSGEVVAGLEREKLEELKLVCTHDNPAFKTWLAFRRGKGGYPPPQKVCTAKKEKKGGLSFPRGRAEEILKLLGPGYVVQDRRTVVGAPALEWKGPEPRAYQHRCVDKLLSSNGWSAGVVRAPTGSGKTLMLLYLAAQLRLKTLVVVPKEVIFNQWVKGCREFLGIEPGQIKGSKRVVGDVITIGMQQTLWNCAEDYQNSFGAVMGDEAQLFAAQTVRDTIDVFPAIFRCAVSQDERRSDGRQFFIYDQFGPILDEVEQEEAKDAGGVVDVEVVIVPSDYRNEVYKSLPPHVKFEKRKEILGDISNDMDRNHLIATLADKIRKDEDEQVMLLTERIEHVENLKRILNNMGGATSFVGGDGKELERRRDAFAKGVYDYAVGTYKAVGVGFESHRGIARGIFASPCVSQEGSRPQFRQFLGRYSRAEKGKKFGRVYYILDHQVFGTKPAKLIQKWVGKTKTFVLDHKLRPLSEWIKEQEDDQEKTPRTTSGSGYFGF